MAEQARNAGPRRAVPVGAMEDSSSSTRARPIYFIDRANAPARGLNVQREEISTETEGPIEPEYPPRRKIQRDGRPNQAFTSTETKDPPRWKTQSSLSVHLDERSTATKGTTIKRVWCARSDEKNIDGF